MENSFSLQFNPLMNVKCVKEYEDEIAQLKAENFELKAQLTHTQIPANLPKVLYENKQQIDSLESQRNELQTVLGNTNRAYETILQEKKMLENKYNQDISFGNEKIGLLEDENKRLVLRLEKFNREIQEAQNIRNELMQASKELDSMKNFIQNLQNQNEQLRYEYEKQLNDANVKVDNYRKSFEAEMTSKNFEVEGYRKKHEAECLRNKNNSLIINDLKSTLNTQIREKTVIEEEMSGASRNLGVQIEELLKKSDDLSQQLKRSEDCIEKMHNDQEIHISGIDKLKGIIAHKMSIVSQSLVEVSERFSKLKKSCYISDDNKSLLTRIEVKYSSINDIITFFREKHNESNRRMEVLKKEVKDATFFASNSKTALDKRTVDILQQFRQQFNEAKDELLICKRYLEKKALENKTLKNENARLLSEALKKGRLVENARRVYEGRTGAQWDAMKYNC